jgi:hypothetical protein
MENNTASTSATENWKEETGETVTTVNTEVVTDKAAAKAATNTVAATALGEATAVDDEFTLLEEAIVAKKNKETAATVLATSNTANLGRKKRNKLLGHNSAFLIQPFSAKLNSELHQISAIIQDLKKLMNDPMPNDPKWNFLRNFAKKYRSTTAFQIQKLLPASFGLVHIGESLRIGPFLISRIPRILHSYSRLLKHYRVVN